MTTLRGRRLGCFKKYIWDFIIGPRSYQQDEGDDDVVVVVVESLADEPLETNRLFSLQRPADCGSNLSTLPISSSPSFT